MNRIKKIHSELTDFQRENKLFTWSIWAAIGVVWSALAWLGLTAHSFVLGMLATMVTGYVANWFCAVRWKQLTTRMTAVDQAVWTVSVNGVRTGELSDAEYARILRSVEFDLRTYISQLLRVPAFAGRVFKDVVVVSPVVIFWGAVIFWLSSPADFVSAVETLKNVTDTDLIAATPALVCLLGVLVLLYVCVLLMGGGLHVFSFDDAIASDVLQAIGCPATGRVTLSQFRQGGVGDKFIFIN